MPFRHVIVLRLDDLHTFLKCSLLPSAGGQLSLRCRASQC